MYICEAVDNGTPPMQHHRDWLDDVPLILVLIIAAEDLRGYSPLFTCRTILRRFTFFGGHVMDM